MPLYTDTSKDWYNKGSIPNLAVNLDIGMNEYTFGRTTPDNKFIVATGLVLKPNGVEMIGGKKVINKKLLKKEIVKKSKKEIDKKSLKKEIVKKSKKEVDKKLLKKEIVKKSKKDVDKKTLKNKSIHPSGF